MNRRAEIQDGPQPMREYVAHCAHCGCLLRPPHPPTGKPEYCPPHDKPEARVRVPPKERSQDG